MVLDRRGGELTGLPDSAGRTLKTLLRSDERSLFPSPGNGTAAHPVCV